MKLNDHGFLSRDITIKDLIEVKSDEHHLFPQAFLKEHGLTRGQYNQIANLAITQSEINIAIGKKAPAVYFKEVIQQCQTGTKKYGNLETLTELAANREQNCIPDGMEASTITDYGDFLAKRRQLMAKKMKTYFEGL